MEATDADNLLEQFEDAVTEAVSEDFVEEENLEAAESESKSSVTNPKKTSNIYKAVQNHFAASAASNSTGGKDNPTRRLPRIGKQLLTEHDTQNQLFCSDLWIQV